MDKRLRGTRVQVMVNLTEAAAIEDFRLQKRMPSKAAAIREVLRRGLAAEDYGLVGTSRELETK